MGEILQSFAIGTSGLFLVFLVSLVLGFSRPFPDAASLGSIKSFLPVAICIHLVHLTEETIFGFYELFPKLIGLAPWPLSLFLIFNIAWVIIWLVGCFSNSRNRIFISTFWFLAIASVINGIAHPIFSIAVGNYFPGLVTSPFVGVVGIILIYRIYMSGGQPTGRNL